MDAKNNVNKNRIKNRYFKYLVIFFIFYIFICIWYSVENYYDVKRNLYREIDFKLLVAAKTLKYILAEDFHDRAKDEDSISYEEELVNRTKFNNFLKESELAWIYTLAEKDGKYYFTAPTVSEEEAKKQKKWYFYTYEDISQEFINSYIENKEVYVEYTDKWGKFRSVAVPQLSPKGRRYLACADYEVSHINKILFSKVIYNVIAAFIFSLIGTFFLLIYKFYSDAINELEKNIEKNKEKLNEEQKRLKMLEEIKCFYQKQAMNDQLTGLLNKGYFFEKMKEMISEYLEQEKEHKMSLMMIDIDNFKEINDENGHLFGDEVIRVISKIIRDKSRKTDIIGRYGGDEFIIFLPETSLEISMVIGRRICDSVSEALFRNEKKKFSPTLSIGVTEYSKNESIEEFMERADHYLYVAKYKNKNRVEGGKKKILNVSE